GRRRSVGYRGEALSGPVPHFVSTPCAGAMRAAIDLPGLLHAMAGDAYAAVRTDGRGGLDRALEAVEGPGPALLGELERLVVVVAAVIAPGHGLPSADRRNLPAGWPRRLNA